MRLRSLLKWGNVLYFMAVLLWINMQVRLFLILGLRMLRSVRDFQRIVLLMMLRLRGLNFTLIR